MNTQSLAAWSSHCYLRCGCISISFSYQGASSSTGARLCSGSSTRGWTQTNCQETLIGAAFTTELFAVLSHGVSSGAKPYLTLIKVAILGIRGRTSLATRFCSWRSRGICGINTARTASGAMNCICRCWGMEATCTEKRSTKFFRS
jgi:hypothetical protein